MSVCALGAHADVVAHFPMEVSGGQIEETVGGSRFAVQGHFAPENVPGAAGQALRFDGYTSWIDASLGNIIPSGSRQMTVSLWAALPCYPIVQIDRATSEMVALASCLDETTKTGFGFFLGFDGKWMFSTYAGGWRVDVKVDTPLPVYTWNNLVAVVDSDARKITLYNNGTVAATARCNGTVEVREGSFVMGRGPQLNYSGPFLLTSYNGLLDDVKIWNNALSQEEIQQWTAENGADLSIPASRFENDILRPRLHGMPAAGWTNECHGMTFADGRYHLFFQKNADGPYMARLHWGHISSENLYDWREEEIALAPGAPYDIKGCWSGCVFTDDEITGGKPGIIYTAVDYARATIAGASPLDDNLVRWEKWGNNPIIDGRPAGLGDDFRDPYFFRNGEDACIIVGSSKDGVGTTTLHRYNAPSGTWSNDGRLFFTGTSAAADGRFWEMPTITPMPGGKWLFTATPLETSTGVRTIYWTGSINADGTFAPDPAFPSGKNVELNPRDGFGLLSPTIYNHQGKTIVMGIVPDKLSAENNWNLGWAHCYSLPREWSLDSNGLLQQKPYEGLKGMRSATSFSRNDFQLEGTVDLAPVKGRQVEIEGTFVIGDSPFGFNIFKNGNGKGTITYNPATSSLRVDFTALNRLVNDGGVYDGIYTCPLPEFLRRGSEVKINVFIDHSILDIFVNDKWATSIRVFPTDADADGMEAFSEGSATMRQLGAWVLDSKSSGVESVTADAAMPVSVYTVTGICLRSGVDPAAALDNLPPALYIVSDGRTATRRLVK